MATAEQIKIKEIMESLGTLKAQMEAQAVQMEAQAKAQAEQMAQMEAQAKAQAEERLAAKAELEGVKAELAAVKATLSGRQSAAGGAAPPAAGAAPGGIPPNEPPPPNESTDAAAGRHAEGVAVGPTADRRASWLAHGLSDQELAALAAAGQGPPPPSPMYVLRGLLMLVGTVPVGFATWGSLAAGDDRFWWASFAMDPLSTLLLVCHFYVTMELTPDPGRLEVLHLALYWLASFAPAFAYHYRATGGVSPGGVLSALFYTYPAYAIINRIRKAVRAHQLRTGTLGAFVNDFFAGAIIVSGIPMLYLTMGSVAAVFQLEPWAIGSEPGADLDDEAEAEAAVAAYDVAYSIVVADYTMNVLLLCLVVSQLALFGTGLSDVRALMAFRVPGYQRIAGTGLIVMGLIALYFQASKGEGGNGACFLRCTCWRAWSSPSPSGAGCR